ncbi:MAG: S41 family peptidase [Bacteroidales bacterium]|nr:S41 family peptidase [Bacteroidales bacterium]
MRKKISALLLSFLITISFSDVCKAQHDFEIAKNVDIFVSILKELNAKYADEISPGDLTKTAIDAMLTSLDPYTVYYPESQIEDYKMMTKGQYGGIGALIQQHGDYIVISEPYEDCPAQQAGLMAGDRILSVNKQPMKNRSSSDVSEYLKGQPGTKINIEVERYGQSKPLSFDVVRKEIKFPSVPYSDMVSEEVGYIKLDQFTEKASSEVKEAFVKLKEQGMKYLIFDLRNNGGGLLQEAVNIMNIFVDQGTLIAETKGKLESQHNVYKTRFPATDKTIPVVVLVNEYSASASEIVSGAFQDLDRGVIMGHKTFGKGLVQNILPLSYNTSLKITIAKYYIPSGRCVQNIEYFKNDTLAPSHTKIPDSLAVPYKTKNGRTVYDKGGVEPDVISPDTVASNLLLALVMNNLIFDYATQFRATHATIPEAKDFRVTDEIYQDFIHFLKDKEYDYTTETEKVMKDLKEVAEEERYFGDIAALYDNMKKKIEEGKSTELQKYKVEISDYLASEIISRYYFQKGKYVDMLRCDPEITAAKQLLSDQNRYKSILSKK